MQVRNSEVVHGQKQSWSTLPSSCQTKKTTLVTNWTHALTKTANKTVFEEIKKVLEERMSIEEFKEENISSFILYWQLKNSSSAFLLQENNFISSSRAAILNLKISDRYWERIPSFKTLVEYCELFKISTTVMWSIAIGYSIITVYLPICREQAEKHRGQ